MARQYNSVVGFFFFIIISFLLSVTQTEADDQKKVPAIFVFGDSLVDVGNNNHIKLSILKANFFPNGIDFPGHNATGRFTNGKNPADLFAEKLGLPTSPPFLSIVSASNNGKALNGKALNGKAFLGGVSFASGGAGILDRSKVLFESLSMDEQIEYYSAVYGGLVEELGAVGSQQFLSKSLFVVVIGSNDILGYFAENATVRQQMTPKQLVDLLSSKLHGQLKQLYDLGARKFVVIGVAPVGCCPAQRYWINKAGECNEEANYLARAYNEALKSLLQKMKSDHNDINYSFVDGYSILLNFIQNPVAYGFAEAKAACCGLGGNFNAAGYCVPISPLCSNRTDHLFWDRNHPTEAAYRLFVENIFDDSKPYVHPIKVRQLAAL